jgi:hypothetical protein
LLTCYRLLRYDFLVFVGNLVLDMRRSSLLLTPIPFHGPRTNLMQWSASLPPPVNNPDEEYGQQGGQSRLPSSQDDTVANKRMQESPGFTFAFASYRLTLQVSGSVSVAGT